MLDQCRRRCCNIKSTLHNRCLVLGCMWDVWPSSLWWRIHNDNVTVPWLYLTTNSNQVIAWIINITRHIKYPLANSLSFIKAQMSSLILFISLIWFSDMMTVADPEGVPPARALPPPPVWGSKSKKNEHILAEVCSRTYHLKPYFKIPGKMPPYHSRGCLPHLWCVEFFF